MAISKTTYSRDDYYMEVLCSQTQYLFTFKIFQIGYPIIIQSLFGLKIGFIFTTNVPARNFQQN